MADSSAAGALHMAVMADVTDYEAAMDKVRRETKKTEKSMFEVGRSGAKAAAVGGAAFSSLGAGISIATASAEGLEGAIVSASGSLVAAFGAGGLAGGALAASSLVLGTLLRDMDLFGTKAEEAAKKARAAWGEFRKEQQSLGVQLRERIELSKGGRALLQGRGEELNTLETEGQMIGLARGICRGVVVDAVFLECRIT